MIFVTDLNLLMLILTSYMLSHLPAVIFYIFYLLYNATEFNYHFKNSLSPLLRDLLRKEARSISLVWQLLTYLFIDLINYLLLLSEHHNWNVFFEVLQKDVNINIRLLLQEVRYCTFPASLFLYVSWQSTFLRNFGLG